MRTSLYDAIGVSASSSTSEIRAALRALVRRFWAVPRDPSGDSEEALRFVSLAAGILTDERRRDNYDVSLSPGVGAGPWRIPVASARQSAVDYPTDVPSAAAIEVGVSQLSVDVARDVTLPGVEAFAENFPGETSRPVVWIAAAAVVALVLTLVASLALTRQWQGGPALALLLSGAVLAGAALIGAATAQRARPGSGTPSLSHLAVIKWRRDGSVFIGVPAPQQDTAWLFRLRMAELTRSNNGYLVQPLPWRRALARAFDLALCTWLAVLAVTGVMELVPEPHASLVANWLLSPLILPTLSVLVALAIEPVWTARYGWTPGKWLLGLYVVSGVTHVGARSQRDARDAARRRAWLVARHGLALGFLPAAALRVRRHWASLRDNEPRWDAAADTVVLARPVAWLPATSAALVVLATVLLLTALWTQQARALWAEAAPWLVAMSPPSPQVGSSTEEKPAAQDAPRREPALPLPAEPRSPAPSAVTRSDTAAPSPNPLPGAAAAGDAEARMARQAASAQGRRARIERAEAAVAAVRRGEGTYGPLQATCQRWTEDQPGSAEAWRCLGLAQYQNGAGTAALPALRTALRLNPKDPEVERAVLMILRPQ